MTKALVLFLLAALTCSADVIYDNTLNDTGFTVFYSAGYSRIGDQIQVVTPGGVSSVDAQFFNIGADATFDATLAFYQVGSPISSLIGSLTATGVSIAGGASQTVTFSNAGNLQLPGDVILAVSIANVSNGGDIGLNFFDPPTLGASNNSFFIADDGGGLAQVSTFMNVDNVYLQIRTSDAPEPSTLGLTLGFVGALVFFKWRRVS